MDCMHVVAHTCRFFFPLLVRQLLYNTVFEKGTPGQNEAPGEFMHITWWLATAKVGSVQWREAGGDSSPRHDFYLGSNPQLARRGPRVLRESTNQENASDAFRHRRPTVQQANGPGLVKPACFSLEFVQGLVVAAAGHL